MASSTAHERPAKIFELISEEQFKTKRRAFSIVSSSKEPPSEPQEIADLVQKYDLHHGDIIRYDDYRDGNTVIVKKLGSGQPQLLRNPDDADAAYLTIPAEILQSDTNFRSKYKAIIDDCAGVNFHVSSKDDFIQELLGVEAPPEWDYDVEYAHGEQQDIICITPPDGSAHEFPTKNLSLGKVMGFFKSREESQETLRLHVKLAGDSFLAYKDKYGTPERSSGWLLAKPALPSFWEVEKGQTSGGQGRYAWDWVATGPVSSRAAAVDAIDRFLTGFEFEYK